MSAKVNRITWIDILRGIGIIFMIAGHIGISKILDIYIHAFHMPLFFVISGFFFKNRKNYIAFLIHDVKTLLLPYTIFFLICQVLHYAYTRSFDIRYSFLSFFTSNHNRIDVSGVYWFLLCLFICKQMVYLLMRFTKGKMQIIAILALTLLGNLIPIKLPLCIDSALSCIALMYIGIILAREQNRNTLNKLISIKWYFLVAFFALNAFLIFLNIPVNIRTNTYGNIVLYWFNCLLAILIWSNISVRLDKINKVGIRAISMILQDIGLDSIVYLTLNELCIFAVAEMLAFLGMPVEMTAVKLLELILVILLINLASRLINKSRLNWLYGKF